MPSSKKRIPPPPSNKTPFSTLRTMPQNNSKTSSPTTTSGMSSNLSGNILQGASFGAGSEIGHRVVNSVFGSKETKIYGKNEDTCSEFRKSVESVCIDPYAVECERLKTLFEKLCNKA